MGTGNREMSQGPGEHTFQEEDNWIVAASQGGTAVLEYVCILRYAPVHNSRWEVCKIK